MTFLFFKRHVQAFFKVWYDIGKSMNIVGVPESKEELLKFKEVFTDKNIYYVIDIS